MKNRGLFDRGFFVCPFRFTGRCPVLEAFALSGLEYALKGQKHLA